MIDTSRVLNPFDIRERITVGQAAQVAGKSESTIRTWCTERGIARRVANGPWQISKVALMMLLDGDLRALRAYQSGDRESELVIAYYDRAGIGDLPRKKWAQNQQISQVLAKSAAVP